MEAWKAIEGTLGLLEVSSEGRIRSNMRDGRILKQQTDNKGYRRVSVTIRRVRRRYKVHRAVASAFLPNPNDLPQVNHINGDKGDNRVCNLEWIRNDDNAHHAIKNGLWGNVFAASSKSNEARKTPIRSVDAITGKVRQFSSVSDA